MYFDLLRLAFVSTVEKRALVEISMNMRYMILLFISYLYIIWRYIFANKRYFTLGSFFK